MGPRLDAFLLALALLSAGAPSWAQQTPGKPPSPPVSGDAVEAHRARLAKLDALFGALQKSGGDAEANAYVDEIWRLWGQSGRSDVDALMARALGGMQTQHVGLANLLLDEVVEIAPDFAEGWNRRATLRYLTGDHDGSLLDIEKTLTLEPRHFGAIAGRAMIHMAAGRWQEALDNYKAALKVNPFLPERLRVLPMLEQKVGAESKKL